MPEASVFIRELASAVAARPLDAKLLVAPSGRVGRQWLDRAAAFGIAVNVQPVTMQRIMRDLAGEAMNLAGLAHPSEADRLAIIYDLLSAARADGSGKYFSGLDPSLAVLRMLDVSLADLDRAGVGDSRSLERILTPPEKARELSRLHAAFVSSLGERKFAWHGAVASLAAAEVEKRGNSLPFLLFPHDMMDTISSLERELWRRWPDANKTLLPFDAGGAAEVSCFVADTPTNEARELFRRLFADAVPLDQVEVMAVRGGGAAAIAQAAAEYFPGKDGESARIEDLPITFSNGVPASGSRPVRLLAAWLDWVDSARTAAGFAAICGSGLLNQERIEEKGASPERLAAFFLSLPADSGVVAICEAVRTATGDAGARVAALELVGDVLAPLVDATDPFPLLKASRRLLGDWCAARGELDSYARRRILEDVFLSGRRTPWPEFDAREWLADLAATLSVMGKGPQPARLHVSGLDGGHSGRRFIFVTGLDDASFPGGDRQDPVLLDRERQLLSEAMPLAADRSGRRETGLEQLLARAGGQVVLTFARRDPVRGGELFPAEALTAAARSRDAGIEGVLAHSAAFVPGAARRHSAREYWLGRGLSTPGSGIGRTELADLFPGLARGEVARSARASREVGVYDGLAPEAGRDFIAAPPVLSASQLECLASCPQEYFFKVVLGLKPPARNERERGRWLGASDRGSLLHQVFREFLAELRDREVRAEYAAHRELLARMATAVFEKWKRMKPPENSLVYRRECRSLIQCCEIFLLSETELQKSSRPLYLEASFGVLGSGTPLPGGNGGAFELVLPSGRVVRLSGTLDRVDRLDAGGLAIWDYKTGKSDSFSPNDPIAGGKLQAPLYAVVLRGMPDQVEQVMSSGYFFPTQRESGRRISYPFSSLVSVVGEVDRLTDFLAAGFFPFQPLQSSKPYNAYEYQPLFDAVGGTRELSAQFSNKEISEKN